MTTVVESIKNRVSGQSLKIMYQLDVFPSALKPTKNAFSQVNIPAVVKGKTKAITTTNEISTKLLIFSEDWKPELYFFKIRSRKVEISTTLSSSNLGARKLLPF